MKTNFSPPILQLGNDGLDQKLIPHYWHYWHLCTYTPPLISRHHQPAYTQKGTHTQRHEKTHTQRHKKTHTHLCKHTWSWKTKNRKIYQLWYLTTSLHIKTCANRFADQFQIVLHICEKSVGAPLYNLYMYFARSLFATCGDQKAEINLVFSPETSHPEEGIKAIHAKAAESLLTGINPFLAQIWNDKRKKLFSNVLIL